MFEMSICHEFYSSLVTSVGLLQKVIFPGTQTNSVVEAWGGGREMGDIYNTRKNTF